MKRFIILFIAAALLISCTAGCGNRSEEEATTDAETPAEAEISTLESYSFESEKVIDLSDLNAWDLDGETVDASYFKDNKITAVCVWTTDGSPCIYNLVYMQNALDDYGDEGLGMLGIVADTATRDDPDVSINSVAGAARNACSSVGAGFTNIASTRTLNEKLGVDYVPMMFFVGPDGVQVGKTFIGSVVYNEFAGEIEALLRAG